MSENLGNSQPAAGSSDGAQQAASAASASAPASAGAKAGNTVKGKGKGKKNISYSCDDDHPELRGTAQEGHQEEVRTEPATAPAAARDSDARSTSSEETFTLRDRQAAINDTHPFGIRIWKPALYKKSRSLDLEADEDLRSSASGPVPISIPARIGNYLWVLTFGLVLFSISFVFSALFMAIGGWWNQKIFRYARLMYKVGVYLLNPFGKFVQLWFKDAYRDEDAGVGSSVDDYFAWRQESGQQGHTGAVFAPERQGQSGEGSARPAHRPVRYLGRGNWDAGRVLFFLWFYLVFTPFAVVIGLISWLGVFSIPMGRLLQVMHKHLRHHPLAIEFWQWGEEVGDTSQFSIILSMNRAFGPRYYKYTIDGIPIIFINLLAAVFFVIIDFYTVQAISEAARFALSLVSIVPLAYFIGQAVASISAQSSMSMGATINAFFSTIVEVFLYLVALKQNKGEMVEGSIIGSFLAGVVLLPGLSMCAGSINRKTQRFNPNSTGVTTTMLFFASGGAFAPSFWYKAFGPSTFDCNDSCFADPAAEMGAMARILRECRCWTSKVVITKKDSIYWEYIRPFSILCAILMFIGYVAGLVFTLRTHAAAIWESTEAEEEEEHGGHDAPNWNKQKSYAVLLSSTWLYAIIAEILVDSVDVVLAHVNVSQKMLGLTIFALVPNTTEFMNGISFAVQGNVALSLEIGSAYALQVCLLQIPALVLWSLRYVKHSVGPLRDSVYIMQFSDWDLWVGVIAVFLYSNVHLEGKSNYFKGLVLVLFYIIAVAGYFFDVEHNGLRSTVAAAHAFGGTAIQGALGALTGQQVLGGLQ